MSGIAKGNGKVHARTTGTITVCNRDLGPSAFVTTAEVTCKVCGPVKYPVTTAERPDVTIRLVVSARAITDGRKRHGAVKRARDLRKSMRNALAASV